mgnify:CR=1 FL=1
MSLEIEILEVIQTERGKTKALDVAKRLNLRREEVEEILDDLVKKGLLKKAGEEYELTEKGKREIEKHRENYIHNRFLHRGFMGTITKALESRGNMENHWARRHGINREAIENIRSSMRVMEYRIEELVPLPALGPGGEGIVVLLMGGRGLVRRVAEMGLTPGVRVKIVRRSPFRGPVEVRVRNTIVALGRGVAMKILVKPLRWSS